MDDIIIYNRELAECEILELNTGIPACVPTYVTEESFNAPLNKGPIQVKKNRMISVKTQISTSDEGYVLTDEDILAPPLIQILYTSETGETVDVSDGAIFKGWGNDGNQFEYDPIELAWRYNLQVSNYQDPGTYTIRMVSGDLDEYYLDSVSASFVIE